MTGSDSTITVHLRLSATLRHRVPAFAKARVVAYTLPDDATVRDLATRVNLDMEQERLVCIVNDKLAQPDSPLHDGDQVHLMHRIVGG